MKVFSIIMLNILIYVACCLMIVILYVAGITICTAFSSTINIFSILNFPIIQFILSFTTIIGGFGIYLIFINLQKDNPTFQDKISNSYKP